MPNIESHTQFCVGAFGEQNRELCYMVNSWMDAPVRKKGSGHRAFRHDAESTPWEAIREYGNVEDDNDPRNPLIERMVLQHLQLDGLISLKEEKDRKATDWTWIASNNLLEARMKWGLPSFADWMTRKEKSFEEYYNATISELISAIKDVSKSVSVDNLNALQTILIEYRREILCCPEEITVIEDIVSEERESEDIVSDEPEIKEEEAETRARDEETRILSERMCKEAEIRRAATKEEEAERQARLREANFLRMKQLRTQNEQAIRTTRIAWLVSFAIMISSFVGGLFLIEDGNGLNVGFGFCFILVSGFMLLAIVAVLQNERKWSAH